MKNKVLLYFCLLMPCFIQSKECERQIQKIKENFIASAPADLKVILESDGDEHAYAKEILMRYLSLLSIRCFYMGDTAHRNTPASVSELHYIITGNFIDVKELQAEKVAQDLIIFNTILHQKEPLEYEKQQMIADAYQRYQDELATAIIKENYSHQQKQDKELLSVTVQIN